MQDIVTLKKKEKKKLTAGKKSQKFNLRCHVLYQTCQPASAEHVPPASCSYHG